MFILHLQTVQHGWIQGAMVNSNKLIQALLRELCYTTRHGLCEQKSSHLFMYFSHASYNTYMHAGFLGALRGEIRPPEKSISQFTQFISFSSNLCPPLFFETLLCPHENLYKKTLVHIYIAIEVRKTHTLEMTIHF